MVHPVFQMVNHVFHADGEYLYYWDWGPGGGANWMIGPEIGGTNRYRTPCHFRYIFSYSKINFEFEKKPESVTAGAHGTVEWSDF